VHQVCFSLNEYIEIDGQKNIKPRNTVGHGMLSKQNCLYV